MSVHRISVYILIITLICCTLPLNAFAQSSGTIADIIAPINKNINHDTSSVQPGAILEYPLTADMFTWSGSPGSAGEPVTLSQLRQGNITVKHSISQSYMLESVTLATTSYKGQTTACVKVAFANEFVSVNSREFKLTLYLSMGSTRKEASEITVYGDFENEEISVGSGDSFVSLGKGKVLAANTGISNLEIDMDNGVQLHTRVSSGRKYYAAAQNKIQNSDSAMLTKYPEIEAVVRLKTINLPTTGKCVSMRDIGSYHVYNAAGAYLGKTDELVAYSDVYYLSSAQININGGTSAKPDSADDSQVPPKKPPIGNSPEEKAAASSMENAVKQAAKGGSKTAGVHVKDVESISASELQAMFDVAAAKGLKSKYTADTMTISGKSVEGRIIINPALAVKLPGDIQLGVYTRQSEINATLKMLKKYYKNKVTVVSLKQKGSFGMPVSIVAKVNLDGMNEKNLQFYSYDKDKNRVEYIKNPKYYIDANGYLHFTTILASDIIVSDGALAKV